MLPVLKLSFSSAIVADEPLQLEPTNPALINLTAIYLWSLMAEEQPWTTSLTLSQAGISVLINFMR